jgi:pyruvate kinase
MKRHAKIICTIGPASQRKETIQKMAKAGMDKARINFSHGTHEEHQKVIDTIRQVNQEHKTGIKVLQDLAGYRIRIGYLKHPIELIKYQNVWMSKGKDQTDEHIPLDFDADIKQVSKGMDMYIDDGKLFLRVVNRSGDVLKLEVFQGGVLKSRKGVNLPDLKLQSDVLTAKDQADIQFSIKNKFDYVAQSFVRSKEDILRVSRMVKPQLPECRIIAKIENREGVENLAEILDACDGVMVARGDLGVSMPIYQIPMIQKEIIRRCNEKDKMVVTATQMLDSMTENARPTRAEVSDVANAILDGTDFVMLSGETAIGNFPVKSVRMMSQIIQYTEEYVKKHGHI